LRSLAFADWSDCVGSWYPYRRGDDMELYDSASRAEEVPVLLEAAKEKARAEGKDDAKINNMGVDFCVFKREKAFKACDQWNIGYDVDQAVEAGLTAKGASEEFYDEFYNKVPWFEDECAQYPDEEDCAEPPQSWVEPYANLVENFGINWMHVFALWGLPCWYGLFYGPGDMLGNAGFPVPSSIREQKDYCIQAFTSEDAYVQRPPLRVKRAQISVLLLPSYRCCCPPSFLPSERASEASSNQCFAASFLSMLLPASPLISPERAQTVSAVSALSSLDKRNGCCCCRRRPLIISSKLTLLLFSICLHRYASRCEDGFHGEKTDVFGNGKCGANYGFTWSKDEATFDCCQEDEVVEVDATAEQDCSSESSAERNCRDCRAEHFTHYVKDEQDPDKGEWYVPPNFDTHMMVNNELSGTMEMLREYVKNMWGGGVGNH
jgi:hypothetical protein